LEFNVSATGTWDSVEDDFSDDPTFTGTVTANGTAYDINDFTFLFEDPEEGGIVTDPRYLASGMSAIVYSADGSAWGWPNVSQGADIANAANLYGIACDGSGHCVAVGDSGTILYSTNGITWTKKTSGTTEQLNNVTYANSTWVAVGEDGSVLSSSDGSTWTLQTTFPPTARLFGVAYGNERWVVAGQTLVQYSADLEEWTDVMPAAAPWRDVATDGAGNWVIVGEGGMRYYSNDNASSFTAASPSIPEHLWSVTYGNGRFIAVGQGGMGWGGETPIITYSDDSGASWSGNVVPSAYAAGAMRPLHDTATNGAGIWAAIGGGGDHLLSTDNGTTWQVIALEKYGVFSVAYRP
jgi:hypothetical protein